MTEMTQEHVDNSSFQSPSIEYAGFWVRVIATMIDGLIMMIPAIIFGWIIPVFGGFLVALLYKPFFESSRLQATPGKALLGLCIVNGSDDRITFKQAFIRYIASFISSAVLGIGYIMAAFTERKQTLHDMIANTYVIKKHQYNINYFDAWMDEVSEIFGMTKQVRTVNMQAPSAHESTSKRLQELADLYKQGLINEEEYLNKKAEILKNI